MAKKKRKKQSKKSFEYKYELIGLVLLVLSVLGIGKLGIAGELVASFSLFLVGSVYMVLLAVSFIVGGYLLIKREWPDFFSTKLIGLYILTIGFLVIMHQDFVMEHDGNMMLIFKTTMDQLVAAFNGVMNTGVLENWYSVGGGIIGCIFALVFDKLFSYTGMQIVSWVFIVVGFCLFTGFSIVDFIRDKVSNQKEKLVKAKECRATKEDKKEKKAVIISNGEEEDEDIEEKDKHIKITSIDDLKKVPVKEEVAVKEDTVDKGVLTTNREYQLPPISILDQPKRKQKETDEASIEKNIEILEKVLKDFKIVGKVVEVHIGPTVAQYELEIASGTRVNKITSINREIALALAKKDVRIEAPIPGKNTVGIEFANDVATPVSFYEIISSKQMMNAMDKKLMVPLGKSIMGDIGVCEINKMPHMLVAGTTGSGKSVCINGIICSILMRARPDEVKLVMVDPKVVELSVYNGVPHLMCPVVSDPKKAAVALAKMVAEMERRYETFSETKTKNIESYNAYIDKWNEEHKADGVTKAKLPYIVVIIDELADLMMVAAKEVEDSILRITQKARAAGIHLIVATQRPSTDVITGLIKANIPSRISFAVGSGIDSRTILDQTGAEKLLGKGDMLFLPIGVNSPTRIQGSFITDDEIKRIIDFTVEQQKAQYDESLMNLEAVDHNVSNVSGQEFGDAANDEDPLYNDIVQFVIESQKASASLLQRRFKLGYNRAARLVDLLEERGIIGPANGSKPREVLVQLDNQEETE